MLAEIPSGRRVWVIWRYDRETAEIPDIFGEVEAAAIFVIIAYSGDPRADASTRHPQR